MSFRTRLGLFFLLMVAIPIAAIAVLASDVTGDSQAGKADAQVSTGLEAAISVYEDEVAAADRAAQTCSCRPLRLCLRLGTEAPQEIERALAAAGAENGLEYLALTTPGGEVVEPIPSDAPVAIVTVTDADGGELKVVASTINADEYLGRVRGVDRPERRRRRIRGGPAVAAEGVDTESLPEAGDTADAEIDGAEARAATASLGDDGASVTVFAPVEGAGFFDSRPRVALARGGLPRDRADGRRRHRQDAPVADRGDARRRAAHRLGRLLSARARGGPRRDGWPRERVQHDDRPARAADRPAAASARTNWIARCDDWARRSPPVSIARRF